MYVQIAGYTMGNMFGTGLLIVATIWRPGLNYTVMNYCCCKYVLAYDNNLEIEYSDEEHS